MWICPFVSGVAHSGAEASEEREELNWWKAVGKWDDERKKSSLTLGDDFLSPETCFSNSKTWHISIKRILIYYELEMKF